MMIQPRWRIQSRFQRELEKRDEPATIRPEFCGKAREDPIYTLCE